ncbi:hypothetical protein [Spirosoma sp. KNUC1025]|uniref:hypothetical protein n=1 Tax=Spirosoma sp. KNUC1025 TaxID=2894082 RepID=UPI00386D6F50|nr:hypothetical protein LN737_03940 [Spirosoma sp. KNUC1025]
MALRRILEADGTTYLLLLVGLIALVCIVLLRSKNRMKQLASSDSRITSKKLKLYDLYLSRYGGDYVRFSHTASKKERLQMEELDNDDLIENLIQDILIVKKGLASNEFADKLQKRLVENCENEQVFEELKSLAGTLLIRYLK